MSGQIFSLGGTNVADIMRKMRVLDNTNNVGSYPLPRQQKIQPFRGKTLNLVAGWNNIYTVPAGKIAICGAYATHGGNTLWWRNDTGSTTASDMMVGINVGGTFYQMYTKSAAVASGNNAVGNIGPVVLSAGDSIAVNVTVAGNYYFANLKDSDPYTVLELDADPVVQESKYGFRVASWKNFNVPTTLTTVYTVPTGYRALKSIEYRYFGSHWFNPTAGAITVQFHNLLPGQAASASTDAMYGVSINSLNGTSSNGYILPGIYPAGSTVQIAGSAAGMYNTGYMFEIPERYFTY